MFVTLDPKRLVLTRYPYSIISENRYEVVDTTCGRAHEIPPPARVWALARDNAVMYRKPPAPPPPIQPNFDSFVVRRVTAHHANILRSESEGSSPLSSHNCDCYDVRFGRLDIRHQRFAHTRPWPRSQRSSPACSTKFAYCKRRPNAA